MIMQLNVLFEADISFTSKVEDNISCFQFQPMQNLGWFKHRRVVTKGKQFS